MIGTITSFHEDKHKMVIKSFHDFIFENVIWDMKSSCNKHSNDVSWAIVSFIFANFSSGNRTGSNYILSKWHAKTHTCDRIDHCLPLFITDQSISLITFHIVWKGICCWHKKVCKNLFPLLRYKRGTYILRNLYFYLDWPIYVQIIDLT